MKLAAPDGQSLEMQIRGYQFPELETEQYDSNWLIIEGVATHPEGNWRFIDPCLLTYELRELADWLSELAAGRSLSDKLDFIEPNLGFEPTRVAEQPLLRVYFELESRPHRAP